MHQDTDDSDLRDLFAALRQEEAQQAPAFEPFWHEAVARAGRRRRAVWMRYAAAAVLLVGLALAAFLLLQPRKPAPSLTAWRSPTASLLRAPAPPAAPLPTSSLLAPPAPRLETYAPDTRSLLPGAALHPDTTN